MGGRRHTPECSCSGGDYDTSSGGGAVDAEGGQAHSFLPYPDRGFGDAGQLADWVLFMLSDAADFLCGSVVFVDGGSDAYFRADDWPSRVPAYRLLSYLKRFRGYSASA